MSMLQHFPIIAIMAYFLGAFLIVMFGKSRAARNVIAFLATATPLCLLIMLVKPVMLGGHRKYGKWVLSDGSALDLELPLRGLPYMESLNLASPGLLNGKFCALQQAQALLLELALE